MELTLFRRLRFRFFRDRLQSLHRLLNYFGFIQYQARKAASVIVEFLRSFGPILRIYVNSSDVKEQHMGLPKTLFLPVFFKETYYFASQQKFSMLSVMVAVILHLINQLSHHHSLKVLILQSPFESQEFQINQILCFQGFSWRPSILSQS